MDNEDGNIENIDFLTEDERHQLLVDFNDTKVDYPKDKTIIDLFEEQVQKTPNNVAVVFEGKELTYTELNEQANQLAKFIKDKYSIKQQQIIATLLPKSIDLIVSFLAIEKLGCIYLPIDINYPKDRIDYIIQDSNAEIVLNKNDIAKILNINKSHVSSKKSLYYVNNIETHIKYNDLSYIIYTSGSTGIPKGVLIEHHSNINMSLDQIRKFGINSEDRVVWFASVAFDASISEIMMSFYSGATLCIPTEEQQKNNDYFISFLKETKSSIITFPPSYLELLDINQIDDLKTIITAGESANPKKAIEIINKGINYFNAYGPTEYSVCTSIFKLRDYKLLCKGLPIGRPIANTQVYILDKRLNPVPIGVIGKLYVAGVGLAKGYLNKPKLTEEKFIVNPFAKGTRMYDTGDLGRWLPDRNIEFLGRNDFQVKIRGYRIELGEIETHLSQYSNSIKQVVAEAKEINGEKVLIAYYTIDKDNTINKTELRQYLQSKLPEYMVPGFFVELDIIPLTPNGKINRKSLPSITDEDIIRKAYVAPRNETEQILTKIWQDVLSMDIVGIKDNFFELGGHSLKVSQIIIGIQKQFGKSISYKIFFENPTIEKIASYLDAKEQKRRNKLTLLIAEKKSRYIASSVQQRMYFIQNTEQSLKYNIPTFIKIKGKFDTKKVYCAMCELIKRHESFRTKFVIQDYDIYQEIIDNINFNIENYYPSSNEEVELIKKNFVKLFSLDTPPLFRVGIIHLVNESVLMFDFHHIIIDGKSAMILFKEFRNLYDEQILMKNTFQYKDYSEIQQSKEWEIMIEEQKKYWIKELHEFKGLELPPHIKTIEHSIRKTIEIILNSRQRSEIDKYCIRENITKHTFFFCAYALFLNTITQNDDFIIGIPVEGRTIIGTENIVGMFVNSLPIRIKFNEFSRNHKLVKNINQKLLSALENQDFEYANIVDEVCYKNGLSQKPIIETMFSFSIADFSLNDWELENTPLLENKFDIYFSGLDTNEEIICMLFLNGKITNEEKDEYTNQFLKAINHLIKL
jgi:amino acid adenylation domain-containing protein